MIPGEYQLAEGDILANVGRKTVTIEVTNSGDRPIQVGSHYHFLKPIMPLNLTALWHAVCV